VARVGTFTIINQELRRYLEHHDCGNADGNLDDKHEEKGNDEAAYSRLAAFANAVYYDDAGY
jgi:hypothetical protein